MYLSFVLVTHLIYKETFVNSNSCASGALQSMKSDILPAGEGNAEGRLDTSAMSLTNSMTQIPPSTTVCRSPSGEARRGEFDHAQYPVAHLFSFLLGGVL